MRTLNETPPYISRQVEMSRLFFLEASEGDIFGVACGGYERCQADYRIDRRTVDWYCLEFVTSGAGRLDLNGKSYELKPGSFYLYGPDMPHCIESSNEQPLSKYFVCFQGEGARLFLEKYRIAPGLYGHCHKADAIRDTFDMLIERGLRRSSLSKSICALLVKQLLLLTSDESAGSINTDSPAYLTYSRARDFIEGNYFDLSSLDAVSKGCGVEAAYLCRLFARFHDESPYQFLTRLRMDHASRLLLEENASVRSVASEMGYKDPFHFSRVFKSVHRIPPSRFRNTLYS